MPTVQVYDLSRKAVGELQLSDAVFAASINEGLMYDVLKAQLQSRRAGTHATKNRSAVAGSTRKLLKQKGSGGARHGDIKSPTYVGGGQSHGPVPRDYGYRPPRKMRQGALRGALSLKLKEGRLVVLKDFELGEVKTKRLAEILNKLEVAKSALIIDSAANSMLRLSARNLEKHTVLAPEGVNLYDLLRHDFLVLTQSAVDAIEARMLRESGSKASLNGVNGGEA